MCLLGCAPRQRQVHVTALRARVGASRLQKWPQHPTLTLKRAPGTAANSALPSGYTSHRSGWPAGLTVPLRGGPPGQRRGHARELDAGVGADWGLHRGRPQGLRHRHTWLCAHVHMPAVSPSQTFTILAQHDSISSILVSVRGVVTISGLKQSLCFLTVSGHITGM